MTKKNLSEDQKILDYYNVYALGVLISGLYMISKKRWGWLRGDMTHQPLFVLCQEGTENIRYTARLLYGNIGSFRYE